MMALDNKAMVRRYVEGLFGKQHKVPMIDEMLSNDFVEYQNYDSSGNRAIRGREEWKKVANMYFSAFPDLECTIEDLIAEGDKVVSRWTTQATHKGDFLGIAPTNKRVMITGISIYRIVEGKIVETRSILDLMGLLSQLGALPAQLKKAA
jgi:steroid delta-isomerase-like uncharacterized protein